MHETLLNSTGTPALLSGWLKGVRLAGPREGASPTCFDLLLEQGRLTACRPAVDAHLGAGRHAVTLWGLPPCVDLSLQPDPRDAGSHEGWPLWAAHGLAGGMDPSGAGWGGFEAFKLAPLRPLASEVGGAGLRFVARQPEEGSSHLHRRCDPEALADWDTLRRLLTWAADWDATVWMPLRGPGRAPAGHDGADDGPWALRQGLAGSRREDEILAVQMALEWGRQTGVRMHVDQISTKEAAESLRQAQRKGQPVTASVSIHHLLFTQVDASAAHAAGRMASPLRDAADREALSQAVQDGVIGAVVSGHRWPAVTEDAGPRHGVPGAGMLVPGLVKWAAARGFPLDQAWRAISAGPAAILDPVGAARAPGCIEARMGELLDLVLVEEGCWTAIWPADDRQAARWGLMSHSEWPGRVLGSIHAGRWWPAAEGGPAPLAATARQ